MSKYRAQVAGCGDGKAVTVSMTVESSGEVSRPQVSNASPAMSGCILKAASGWRFPKRDGGQPARVSYKFTR
jgi:hypothetical protein